MNQDNYCIVEAPTLQELANLCSAKINEGYVPCGTIVQTNQKMFLQSLVRIQMKENDINALWNLFETNNQRIRF